VLPEWLPVLGELIEDLREVEGLGSEPDLKAAFRRRFKCRHKDANLLWQRPEFPDGMRPLARHPTQAELEARKRGKPVIDAWASKK
jgi:hypothetical protein